MMLRVVLSLALVQAVASQAAAADVTFRNDLDNEVVVSMFVGPVGTSPDNRGQSNAHIGAGRSLIENVGDGDVWYAYSNQGLNAQDNPQLCNAAGGDTVDLDASQNSCYVNN